MVDVSISITEKTVHFITRDSTAAGAKTGRCHVVFPTLVRRELTQVSESELQSLEGVPVDIS